MILSNSSSFSWYWFSIGTLVYSASMMMIPTVWAEYEFPPTSSPPTIEPWICREPLLKVKEYFFDPYVSGYACSLQFETGFATSLGDVFGIQIVNGDACGGSLHLCTQCTTSPTTTPVWTCSGGKWVLTGFSSSYVKECRPTRTCDYVSVAFPLISSLPYTTVMNCTPTCAPSASPIKSPSRAPIAYMYTTPIHNTGQHVMELGKLVSTNGAYGDEQGSSVAMSGNGDTVASGAPYANANEGGVWIFTRSKLLQADGSTYKVWSQQSNNMLVGTGAIGKAKQGFSVALSSTVAADGGSTLASGGYQDNNGMGAVWIFTRTTTSWLQQGQKLVGTGNVGQSAQGSSVALSSDGNTLVVGGPDDQNGLGAVWVFIRTTSTWSQQGSKLTGTGSAGQSQQGFSVALSSDGNTCASGGHADHRGGGAVWIFVRNSTAAGVTPPTWTQQGRKLVGTWSIGDSNQGYSVSLSSNGNVLASGGPFDNPPSSPDDIHRGVGAVWIFTRTNMTTWSQQGQKLVGSNPNKAGQGSSVALNGVGNTVISGGPGSSEGAGGFWLFSNSGLSSSSSWVEWGEKQMASSSDDGVGNAGQGSSVAFTADGNIIAIGGPWDNAYQGAVWLFDAQAISTGVTNSTTSPTPTDGSSAFTSSTSMVRMTLLSSIMMIGVLYFVG
jgi:hypothetical protein